LPWRSTCRRHEGGSGIATDTRVARLRTLAYWLDAGIPVPGTSFRFGLDPIIGLIPGFGDAVGAVLSGGILIEAAMMGVSRATMLRMALNIAIDSLVGSVPVVGDLFDFVWKSNLKNMALLDRALENPRAGARADRLFLTFLLIVLLVVSLGLAVGGALLISRLIRLL